MWLNITAGFLLLLAPGAFCCIFPQCACSSLLAANSSHQQLPSGFPGVVDVSEIATADENICTGGSRVFLQSFVDGSAPVPAAVAHTRGCCGGISPAELVSQVGTRAAPSCSSDSLPRGSVEVSQQCVTSTKDLRLAGRPPSVAVSVVGPSPCAGGASYLASGTGLFHGVSCSSGTSGTSSEALPQKQNPKGHDGGLKRHLAVEGERLVLGAFVQEG